MATNQDTTYNGWSNYPTWNIKLWMDNDQGSYEYWQERANECYQEAEPQYEGQPKLDEATLMLAGEIECYYTEAFAEMTTDAGPMADIMGWAMGQVDFREIAENMLSEVEPEAA